MNTDDRIQEAPPNVPATKLNTEVRELPNIVAPPRRWYAPANLGLLSIQVMLAMIVWYVLVKFLAMLWSWKQMADALPRG
jgi:hypothetical protein